MLLSIALLSLELSAPLKSRPFNTNCDVGAFESTVGDIAQAGPTFTVNTLVMNNDGVCGIGNCSLIEAINTANAIMQP